MHEVWVRYVVFCLLIWVCHLKTRETAANPSIMVKLSKNLMMLWGSLHLEAHLYLQASFKINKDSVFCPFHFHFPSDYAAWQPGAIAELVDSKARVLVEEQHQQRQWLGPIVATGGSLNVTHIGRDQTTNNTGIIKTGIIKVSIFGVGSNDTLHMLILRGFPSKKNREKWSLGWCHISYNPWVLLCWLEVAAFPLS